MCERERKGSGNGNNIDSQVEPAVEEAQTAVKGIKKATLVEVGSERVSISYCLEVLCGGIHVSRGNHS